MRGTGYSPGQASLELRPGGGAIPDCKASSGERVPDEQLTRGSGPPSLSATLE